MSVPQSLDEWYQEQPLVEEWSSDKCPMCGKLFRRSPELQELLDKKPPNEDQPALISWIEELLTHCTVSADPDKWLESPLVKQMRWFLVRWLSFHAQGPNDELREILYLCADTLQQFPPHFAVCACKKDYSNVPECLHPGCSGDMRRRLICEIRRSAAHSTEPVPNHRQIAYRYVFRRLSRYARNLHIAREKLQKNKLQMIARDDPECSSFDDI
jgi:hypothetical protein